MFIKLKLHLERVISFIGHLKAIVLMDNREKRGKQQYRRQERGRKQKKKQVNVADKNVRQDHKRSDQERKGEQGREGER